MSRSRARLIPAYSDAFYVRYPLLYSQLDAKPATCPLSQWGVECGAGWKKPIEKLSAKLERMIEAMPPAEQKCSFARQVKQKFAQLRFYLSWHSEEAQKAIAEASDECSRTCEICGKKGELRTPEFSGHMIACEEHGRYDDPIRRTLGP